MSNNIFQLPTSAPAPVSNPRTRGPKKGTASFMVAKRQRRRAELERAASPYMPEATGCVPEVVTGKFNYPTLLLWQRYFCLGGMGARYLPTLNASMLVDEKFISPLGSLLQQLAAEGHDVEGARIEYLALREAAGNFTKYVEQLQMLMVRASEVARTTLGEKQ